MIRLANTLNTRNCGRVCLLYQKETTIYSHAKRKVRVLRRFTQLLFAVRTSSIATANKKETMITSTHNLLSSFLRGKVIHFLLSRKCKLDRDFLHLELRFLVCVIAPITTTVFKAMLRKKGKSNSTCRTGVLDTTEQKPSPGNGLRNENQDVYLNSVILVEVLKWSNSMLN